MNITMDGIKENKKEDTAEVVLKILNSHIPHIKKGDFTAKRYGRSFGKKPKPIFVTFNNYTTREEVITKASKIKEESKERYLWINKDITRERRRDSTYLRICKKLLEESYPREKPAIIGGGIKFKNELYNVKQLNDLPPGCRICDAQQIFIEDKKAIAFAGEFASLSNLHICKVEYNNQIFNSVEQAFQFTKAKFHNKNFLADEILLEERPFEIKHLGDQIKTNKTWRKIEANILYEIVGEKMVENRDIRNSWQALDIDNHYEATVGKRWGCGFRIPYAVQAIEEKKEMSSNVFGRILNRLHGEFAEGLWKNGYPAHRFSFTREIIEKDLKDISQLNIDDYLIEKYVEEEEIAGEEKLQTDDISFSDPESDSDIEEVTVQNSENTARNEDLPAIKAKKSTPQAGSSSKLTHKPEKNVVIEVETEKGAEITKTSTPNKSGTDREKHEQAQVSPTKTQSLNSDSSFVSPTLPMFRINEKTKGKSSQLEYLIREDENSPLGQRKFRRNIKGHGNKKS